MSVCNLTLERQERGWSLEFVAQKIDITKQSLFSIEKGKSRPSYEILCALEDLFQRPHRYLLAQVGEGIPTFSCYCGNIDNSIVAREVMDKQVKGGVHVV